MRTIYARQGDLVIDRVAKAPVELTETQTPTVIAGSHDGEHTLPAGVRYGRDNQTHYVQAGRNVSLTHATRHHPIPLEAGQMYAIWPQIERHGEGDQDVED